MRRKTSLAAFVLAAAVGAGIVIAAKDSTCGCLRKLKSRCQPSEGSDDGKAGVAAVPPPAPYAA